MKTRARENPFISERVEGLLTFEPEWLGQTWSGMMMRLRDLKYRVAIVGPHGSGKTTLLSGLKTRFEEQGLRAMGLFLNDERRTLDEGDWQRLADVAEDKSAAEGAIVILDGAEQMSWRDWSRFKKLTDNYRGLVITQHRQGKLPLLVRTETNLEMFRKFVWRLAPELGIGDELLDHIFSQTRGNIREALWQCYDLVACGSEGK